ncbi:MAG: hypothetical protein KGM49_13430 [Sphingomonadales bacterium]|nr:hypothetical protein [Sphingomonadales bacterium]
MSATVLPVGTAQFASGWDKTAPADPGLALSGLHQRIEPSAVTRFVPVEPQRPAIASHPYVVRNALPTAARRVVEPVEMVAKTDAMPITQAGPETALASVASPVAPTPVALVETAAKPTAIAPTATPILPSLSQPAPAVAAAPVAAVPAPIAEPLKIVSSPELRRFDLARFAPSAKTRPAHLAAAKSRTTAVAAKTHAVDQLIDGVVFHQTSILVAGHPGGDIAVRIGSDMKPSVKVADLIGLVSAQMDPDSVARFSLASSAGEYVSFATLRSAGFEVSYNAAADSIAIGVSQ